MEPPGPLRQRFLQLVKLVPDSGSVNARSGYKAIRLGSFGITSPSRLRLTATRSTSYPAGTFFTPGVLDMALLVSGCGSGTSRSRSMLIAVGGGGAFRSLVGRSVFLSRSKVETEVFGDLVCQRTHLLASKEQQPR